GHAAPQLRLLQRGWTRGRGAQARPRLPVRQSGAASARRARPAHGVGARHGRRLARRSAPHGHAGIRLRPSGCTGCQRGAAAPTAAPLGLSHNQRLDPGGHCRPRQPVGRGPGARLVPARSGGIFRRDARRRHRRLRPARVAPPPARAALRHRCPSAAAAAGGRPRLGARALPARRAVRLRAAGRLRRPGALPSHAQLGAHPTRARPRHPRPAPLRHRRAAPRRRPHRHRCLHRHTGADYPRERPWCRGRIRPRSVAPAGPGRARGPLPVAALRLRFPRAVRRHAMAHALRRHVLGELLQRRPLLPRSAGQPAVPLWQPPRHPLRRQPPAGAVHAPGAPGTEDRAGGAGETV
ncbi:MAG: hypothetical protein AVDCRST_MAG77-5515, partial [uncultured Chloroflexi bacterium]